MLNLEKKLNAHLENDKLFEKHRRIMNIERHNSIFNSP